MLHDLDGCYVLPPWGKRAHGLLISVDGGVLIGHGASKKFTQNANGRACTTSPTIACCSVVVSCKLADETVHAIMAEDKFSVCGQNKNEKNGEL